MNKKEKLAFAFVAALAMTSGGFAFGQSVNNVSSNQVIYACVTGVNGNITKVSNTPKTCPKGTTPISWNMVGPKGDQGIQGLQGIQGVQGLKGDDGAQGLQGPIGETGPSDLYTFTGTVNRCEYGERGKLMAALSVPAGSYLVDVFGALYWYPNFDGAPYVSAQSKDFDLTEVGPSLYAWNKFTGSFVVTLSDSDQITLRCGGFGAFRIERFTALKIGSVHKLTN